MATLSYIKGKIETSKKNIKKYSDKVVYYDNRISSCLSKLGTKFGLNLEVGNYKDLLTISKDDPKYSEYSFAKYDLDDLLEYKELNEKKLAEETRKEAELHAEYAMMKSEITKKERERAKLLSVFSEKLSTARAMWMRRMEDWSGKHYEHIHSRKEDAQTVVSRWQYLDRIRFTTYCGSGSYSKTKEEKDAVWSAYKDEYHDLSLNVVSAKQILSDTATNYKSKEEYVKFVLEGCARMWEKDLIRLTDDCNKYELDADNVVCNDVNPTERGFEIVINDGKPRTIHARMIWCAESSILVTPHARYIITKKAW